MNLTLGSDSSAASRSKMKNMQLQKEEKTSDGAQGMQRSHHLSSSSLVQVREWMQWKVATDMAVEEIANGIRTTSNLGLFERVIDVVAVCLIAIVILISAMWLGSKSGSKT